MNPQTGKSRLAIKVTEGGRGDSSPEIKLATVDVFLSEDLADTEHGA